MGTGGFFAAGPERADAARNNLYPRGQRRACVDVHTRKSEKTTGTARWNRVKLAALVRPLAFPTETDRFVNRQF